MEPIIEISHIRNRIKKREFIERIVEKLKLMEHILQSMHKIVVYAIGGNALQNPMISDSSKSAEVLAKVMSDVVDLLESGWGVVLTHGNGPQVGLSLIHI